MLYFIKLQKPMATSIIMYLHTNILPIVITLLHILLKEQSQDKFVKFYHTTILINYYTSSLIKSITYH